jgi:hypothetical protein
MRLACVHLDNLGRRMNAPPPLPARTGRGWLQIGGRGNGSVKVDARRPHRMGEWEWVVVVQTTGEQVPPHALEALEQMLWTDLTSAEVHCKGVSIRTSDDKDHTLGDVRVVEAYENNGDVRLEFVARVYQVSDG